MIVPDTLFPPQPSPLPPRDREYKEMAGTMVNASRGKAGFGARDGVGSFREPFEWRKEVMLGQVKRVIGKD